MKIKDWFTRKPKQPKPVEKPWDARDHYKIVMGRL